MNIRAAQAAQTETYFPAWVAFDMDNLDGSGPIGFGDTAEAAINNLQHVMEKSQ